MASAEASWDAPANVLALRSECSDQPPWALDDACLRRVLRARKGDVGLASKMLKRHVQWRMEECVAVYGWPSQAPVDSGCLECLRLRSAYVRGTDREGRPMIYMRMRYHRADMPREALRRFCIFQLDELLTRCSASGVETFTAIVDAAGMGYAQLDTDVSQRFASATGLVADR